jgi:prepilin-type N-terminal cleavage/methylation domain-containing protein
MNDRQRRRKTGMSLMELLCVIGIIAILAGLYLSSISKTFGHVKHFLNHLSLRGHPP